jgi:hypothetical protein
MTWLVLAALWLMAGVLGSGMQYSEMRRRYPSTYLRPEDDDIGLYLVAIPAGVATLLASISLCQRPYSWTLTPVSRKNHTP